MFGNGEGTHLFLAKAKPTPHVANQAAITLSLALLIVLPIGKIIVAARHFCGTGLDQSFTGQYSGGGIVVSIGVSAGSSG